MAERSTSEIRRDIENTRAAMHETVEALERKFSPGELVDQIWDRVGRGGAGAVGDVIRDHPVPLAMVGAGLAWLAIEKATGGEDSVTAESEDDEGTVEKAGDKAGSTAETVKDKAGSVMETAKGKAADLADDARELTGDAKHGAATAARRARDKAGRGKEKVKRGFWTGMERQPLAMGAVAFGLGLASGLATPSSRWEDHAVGGAAESVKKRAAGAARDVGESAKRVVKDAAASARDEADRQGLTHDLKDSVREVAREAVDTAKESAAEEDLGPEGLKQRAAEAGGEGYRSDDHPHDRRP